MIRLYDGKKVVDIEMREGDFKYDEAAFFDDGGLRICHDFIDHDGTVYSVDDIDYCVDYAHDWEKCCGDFDEDFEDYCGKRSVLTYPMAHVRIVGGEDDGSVAFVGTLRDAKQYAKIAESELPEDQQGVVSYCVFDENGEEE